MKSRASLRASRLPRFLLLILSFALAGFAAAQTPTVSITAIDAAASEAGANPGRFRLSRTGSTTNPLTVQIRLRGSATQGEDYTFNVGSVGNTLTIPAGAGFLDVVAQPIDDILFDEGNEDIRLEVRSPLAAEYTVGAEFAAEVDIADNDVTPDPPVLTAEAAFSGFESGPLPATFRIIREGTANVALNVLYSLTGTASAGADYVAPTGSIAMPAGVMSVNVSVPVIDDTSWKGPRRSFSRSCPRASPRSRLRRRRMRWICRVARASPSSATISLPR